MGKIIELAEEPLKDGGANYAGLRALSNPVPVYRTLVGRTFNSAENFIKILNEAIKSQPAAGLDHRSADDKKDRQISPNKVATLPSADMIPEPLPIIRRIDRYQDIGGVDWALEAIYYLLEQDIMTGRSETEFFPNDAMTREEFAKVLALSFNMEGGGATTVNFSDVDRKSWYYPYVAGAVNKGVINGYGSQFGVGDPITREDLVTVVYRAILKAGIRLKKQTDLPNFEDEEDVSVYAKEAVSTMYGMGFINGTGNNLLEPRGHATRAQAAKIMHDVLRYVNKEAQ